MDHGRDQPGAGAPAVSARWVAQRLGISTATLRSWHHRYGVGPTGRSPGGHRRYAPADVDRLMRMRRLVLTGLPVAEAARASAHETDHAPPPSRRRRGGGRALALPHAEPLARELGGAVMAMDQPAAERTIVAAVRAHGVPAAWNGVVVPVLRSIGDRFERCGDCIEVEHLFTEVVQATLTTVLHRPRRWLDVPPVLLACPDDERHTLPLYAVAAALAEARYPSRMLGASVPVTALTSAVRRTGPRAVFLWAQRPESAQTGDLEAIPRRRPPIAVLVGGPGWSGRRLPAQVERVDSLGDALDRLGPALDQVPPLP
jgi:DNA-binding transcriptional MerR regulator